MNSWLLPALLSLLCWGLWGFLPKLSAKYITPISILFYQVIGFIIATSCIFLPTKLKPEFHLKGTLIAVLIGIIGVGGQFFLLRFKQRKNFDCGSNYSPLSCHKYFPGILFIT